VEGYAGDEIYLRNCTLHNGIFYGSRSADIPISVRDCAFDQVMVYFTGDGFASDATNTDYSYNAYADATDPFPSPGGASHDQASVVFNWQSGPLGRFYLPSDSVLSITDIPTPISLGCIILTPKPTGQGRRTQWWTLAIITWPSGAGPPIQFGWMMRCRRVPSKLAIGIFGR